MSTFIAPNMTPQISGSSPALQNQLVNPISNPVWRELVEKRAASLFHSPEWIGVVAETYGFTPCAVVLRDGDGPVAGLAWTDIDDLFGQRRISMPFCDYAGPITRDESDSEQLVRHVGQGLAESLVSSVTVRAFPDELPPWFIESGDVSQSSWMGIDLRGSRGEVVDRISSSARKGVRKAQRKGVSTGLAGNKDDLRAWFELHLRVRKYKFGLFAQPFDFFERIWDTFMARDRGFLVLTFMDDQIVGGMFCLQQDDVVYTKFSASDERAHHMKLNNLLYMETINESMERGARLIDMGRNQQSATGLIYFKESFGAEQRELLSVTLSEPDAADRQRSESRKLVSQLTGLLTFKDVPDKVTEAAGNLLYRYFA